MTKTDHLKTLGQGKTVYRYDNPGTDLLETFASPYQKGQVPIVSIDFPEFTSCCPVTGQPDFGRIVVEYMPFRLCVESKSFKLYMMAYRNHQAFMEAMTANMCQDFADVLQPIWIRVCGIYNARGGTHLHAFAEHFSGLHNDEQYTVIQQWKHSRQFARTGGFNN